MVGSVVLDRPNIIEREKVVQIMERFRLGELSHQRTWLPNILVQILSTPTNTRFVALMDAPAGLLYIMRSPKFIPEHLRPLEYAAIGSGNQAHTEIKRTADWIFAGDVGNPFVESEALRNTVSQFIEQNQIETVGGLYPCIKIDRSGVQMLGIRTEIPIGGTIIEITADPSGRWVQRNLSSGREIPLLFPWELNFRTHYQDHKFDDLLEAQRSFRNPQG
jgi:hypothetical protein